MTDSTIKVLHGQCLCGAVKYTVLDAFQYALNCHCSQCRRVTGSAFKPFGGIESGKLEVTAGKKRLVTYGTPETHDAHCGACGSLLYSVVREGQYVHVTYGTLIDEPSLHPTAHIYVGSKSAWHSITDSLPQHDELP